MERCQMFLLRCSKWIQHHSGRFRTLPAEFQIFTLPKKTLFQWYTFGQNPHTTDNLRGFLSKFNILSSPFRFNYGFHNFWHSINWLLSFSDRSCVPNMIECILPHVHGPLVTCVLFTSLYILCKFKSTCKFSFYGHAIMTSRKVTIFFTDSRSS